MRLIAIGLAAAALAAFAPAMASAADKPDAKAHDQGMKEAPPLAQQAGVNCTITDANFIGENDVKDDKGKSAKTKYYEIACQEGLGYVLIAPAAQPVNAIDCLALTANKPAAGQPDNHKLYCRLPANADPVKGLQPIVNKAGVASCTVAQARWMGSSPSEKFDQYEIGCSEGPGYVLQVPQGGSSHALMAVDCLTLSGGACQYYTKDKMLAQVSAMAAPANRPCQVTDAKWMGTSDTNKHSYFEIACSDAKAGYVLEVDASDKYVSSIDCARASSIGNGCTLTSAAAAQTAELDTYNKLAKEIGYPCAVSSYHSFGLDQKTGREIVEVACSDHPDGAIAMFPTDKGQTGAYVNCIRAVSLGLKCALTTDAAAYAKITSEISGKGKTCQVSNARSVGVGSSGDDYVEVACSGSPGLMVEYQPGPEVVKEVLTCADAKGIGGGCTLPK